MREFEDVLSVTSTDIAPWYIVPANHKWYRNLVIADRVVDALEGMNLECPAAPKDVNFNRLKIP